MSKSSDKVGAIIDKFYAMHNCNEGDTRLLIKDYQIDGIRSFQIIYAVKDSLEFALAGILYDYEGPVVMEYNSPGEVKDYDDDRDEREKNIDKVVM